MLLRLTPEQWIALASATVAAAAFIVAVWQGVLTRRHNRLSVIPHLRIDSLLGGDPVEIILSNRGAGPAIIKRSDIFADSPTTGSAVEQMASALKAAGAGGLKCAFVLPRPGDFVSPGESIRLLAYENMDEAQLKRINEALPKITFEYVYSSIYGTEHKVSHAARPSPALAPTLPIRKGVDTTEVEPSHVVGITPIAEPQTGQVKPELGPSPR